MARRLILDTGILIAAERTGSSLAQHLDDDDDVVVAAVTAAELMTGVELASPARQEQRAAYVAELLDLLPVEPYDLGTAKHHAVLLAHTQRTGQRRGAHDLIIAATVRATGRGILTTDKAARFSDLPGVSEILVS